MNSRKFAGYKVNIQKYFAFLNTNNEFSESKKKKNSFKNHIRKNKIPLHLPTKKKTYILEKYKTLI